jgi:hypothetical protein
VVKTDVLKMLLDTYQGLGDADHALTACQPPAAGGPGQYGRPSSYSVAIKKQCKEAGPEDRLRCRSLRRRSGTGAEGPYGPKPAARFRDDWKKQTAAAIPSSTRPSPGRCLFEEGFQGRRSRVPQGADAVSGRQTTSGTGLVDTLNLAEAYVKLAPPDAVNAVWFYARAWNFAPASFKPQIEKKLDYWYNKYHGAMDGLDAIKTQAQATEFPPGTLVIKPADTRRRRRSTRFWPTTPDLTTLALADKELVLAFGAKDDADKLWALMKDKETPVPGTVIDATASQIKVAVTDDAKQSKVPDFIVNLKEPIADKDIPKAGDEFKLMSEGGPELDGTYDTYTQIPGTDTVGQSAQIVLREAFIRPRKSRSCTSRRRTSPCGALMQCGQA